MSGEQPSEHTDRRFEKLRLGVHIERDMLNDVFDCSFKARPVIQDNERVYNVDQGEGEVSGNVVGSNVGAVLQVG
jgi:hypothetical protein